MRLSLVEGSRKYTARYSDGRPAPQLTWLMDSEARSSFGSFDVNHLGARDARELWELRL